MRRFHLFIAFMAILLLGGFPLHAGDPGPTGATTKNVLYKEPVIIWPNFSYGTGVIDNGVGAVTSGQSYTLYPMVTTTYTLTVTNPAGDVDTRPIQINVAVPAMTALSPASKYVSCTKTFTPSGGVVSGCYDPSVTWSVDGYDGGNATVGTITGTGTYTAPATAGTHTLRCTSNATGALYQEATVNVVPLPTIDVALAAAPGAINYGGTSVLSGTFSNGTGVLTGGTVNQTVTSPFNFTTPTLTATTTYTLTVTNLANDFVTGQVTVNVSAVSMTPLSPTTKTLSLTKSFQPSGGVVSGAVDPSVTWSVNGVAGGDATNGTIAADGTYQAPASMPTSPTITIRCTSNANPAVYSEMTITLVPLPVINYFVIE